MDVHAVHAAVMAGRVVKAPNYHPGKRGLSFLQILAALERCTTVLRDHRLDAEGQPLHRLGWYALSNLPGGRRLRVDFNAVEDDSGDLLLVVTAYDA